MFPAEGTACCEAQSVASGIWRNSGLMMISSQTAGHLRDLVAHSEEGQDLGEKRGANIPDGGTASPET